MKTDGKAYPETNLKKGYQIFENHILSGKSLGLPAGLLPLSKSKNQARLAQGLHQVSKQLKIGHLVNQTSIP